MNGEFNINTGQGNPPPMAPKPPPVPPRPASPPASPNRGESPGGPPTPPAPRGSEARPETGRPSSPKFTPAGGGMNKPPSAPPPEFFSPETVGPSPIPEGVEGKGGALKTIVTIIVAIIFVGGVGALGYFVIFPLVFPPQAPVTGTPPTSGGVMTSDITHSSFLISSPAAEADVTLSDLNYLTIATNLQNESFNQLADGQLKEVRINDANGQVPFSSYLSAINPVVTALGVGDWFEEDFTSVFYYDANGVWPVYVARMKSGVSDSTVTNGFSQIESVLDLGNFYIASPGTFGSFKDGSAGGFSTRYSVGTQLGAAFNYGVAGEYFILSTNYNAMQAVLPMLGL